MKLIEIFKKLRESNKKLFYGNLLSNVPCMHDYLSNSGVSQIDKILVRKYGSREFECLEDEDYVLSEWEDVVEGYILSNEYNLDKMWEMLHEEYKPLYNYDKHSEIEIKHEGDILIKEGKEFDKLTKDGTETHSLTKDGTETHSLTKDGTETHSLTKDGNETRALTMTGQENESNNYGNTTSKHTTSNIAWDSNTEEKSVVVDDSTPAHTDSKSKTYEGRVDSEVLGFANREDKDELSFANREDKKEHYFEGRKDSVNYTDTTKEETYGNIGVKSSSELMVEEFDARWKVNFYMELFTNLIFDLTW